ncbi:multidrug effflux MFS transporter [Geobacter sp. FeAm09]|uniref:multidrug effflux MFS transporter n=1 Tax=Geobacter sp. FeAm09 TaxID=2597769 RepID=UPI0011EEDC65|nr:multidrug effflux MFS transporter [Geobacter sp. FeAm09]QEM69948.1 multidrug effflux MFS transporter [Geobacter sp. FeAm09]
MQENSLQLAELEPLEHRTAVNINKITLILGMLFVFAPLSTDMYLSSFPSIAASLGCGVEQVQYSLSAFVLGLAVGQLFYGPLIDRFGRRLPLLAGVAIFTVTSLLTVWAPDIATFTGLRFLQAVGGCAGMIVSRAVITDLFDEQQAAQALSAVMLVQGAGPIAAPIIGGYIHLIGGWPAVFVSLTLFGAACFILAARGLPETLPVHDRQRQGAGHVLKAFGNLMRRREFMVPALASSLVLASMFAFISGSPFVFMGLHGVSQQQYGWLFGVNTVGMVAASQLNRLLLRRFSPRTIFIRALLVHVVAAALLLALATTTHLALLMLPLFFCLATIPVIGANAVAAAMAQSGRHAGSASSLVGVLQFGLASLVSALVSMLHNGTAYPMAAMILACGLLAGGVLLMGRLQSHRQ